MKSKELFSISDLAFAGALALTVGGLLRARKITQENAASRRSITESRNAQHSEDARKEQMTKNQADNDTVMHTGTTPRLFEDTHEWRHISEVEFNRHRDGDPHVDFVTFIGLDQSTEAASTETPPSLLPSDM